MYKSTLKILAAAIMAASIQCCTPVEEQIKASSASLMTINRGIDSVYNLLNQSYETFQASEMDNALAGLNKYLDQASQNLRDLNLSDDCKPLCKAISDKVETLRSIAATESKEQVRLYKIPDSDFSDELRRQWDNISARVDKKFTEASAKVTNANNELKKKQKKSNK
jgi:hypothetical protein